MPPTKKKNLLYFKFNLLAGLMTVVMKNSSGLENSRSSSGTTLFVLRSGYINREDDPLKQWESAGRDSHKVDEAKQIMPVVGRSTEHHAGGRFNDNNSRDLAVNDDEDEENAEDKSYGDGSKSFTEIARCLDDVAQSMKSAYAAREKRLMTHLGLKGELGL